MYFINFQLLHQQLVQQEEVQLLLQQVLVGMNKLGGKIFLVKRCEKFHERLKFNFSAHCGKKQREVLVFNFANLKSLCIFKPKKNLTANIKESSMKLYWKIYFSFVGMRSLLNTGPVKKKSWKIKQVWKSKGPRA